MVSAQAHPHLAAYFDPDDQEIRAKQSLRVGCFEMERIIQEIVVPEFEAIGNALMKIGEEVELVLLDTQSPVDEEHLIFSAGLKVGHTGSAIVFTADPEFYNFSLQIQSPNGKLHEEEFRYHELIPQKIHHRMERFLKTHYPQAQYTPPKETCPLVFQNFTPPFRLQIRTPDNKKHILAIAESFEDAIYMASTLCQTVNVEDSLIVLDASDRELA